MHRLSYGISSFTRGAFISARSLVAGGRIPARNAWILGAGAVGTACLLASQHTSCEAKSTRKTEKNELPVIKVAPVGRDEVAGEDLIGMLRHTTQCATISGQEHHPNLVVLDSPAIRGLFTIIRNKDLDPSRFAPAANRLMNVLAELGMGFAPSVKAKEVETPCGIYHGLQLPTERDIVVVSIVRGGDALQTAVSGLYPGAPVGKILIQRDESTNAKKPVLLYQKLPDLGTRTVVLTDPMLATAGSACRAIKQLLEAGAKEHQIMFLTVLSAPEGLRRLAKEHPSIRVITCAVDEKLNGDKYIVPGLGDFGDRYYGTLQCADTILTFNYGALESAAYETWNCDTIDSWHGQGLRLGVNFQGHWQDRRNSDGGS